MGTTATLKDGKQTVTFVFSWHNQNETLECSGQSVKPCAKRWCCRLGPNSRHDTGLIVDSEYVVSNVDLGRCDVVAQLGKLGHHRKMRIFQLSPNRYTNTKCSGGFRELVIADRLTEYWNVVV
ncbi:MAG: hypothetical protein ACYC96_15565 [Fimbriimonadaceae bacterium]